ncbi:DUF4843 domain-containing protein [Pinibacter soli]|uniref:DUF4843 domain-containing protein n=1 Tax=Pinibacter soli TaxID=3044211 RepID=A0ABT6RDB5_9BACT|nr:DUF4843 domain-containing protein [Pinibacter soli]MDI3320569.1 DUF4843 domain-containing protein [Pinibacter soli]
MKKLFPIILLVLTIASCKKAEELKYNSPDNIVFNFSSDDKDSILYTFAYTPDMALDTIMIPVRISGVQTNTDRKFVIKAMPDSSTAVPGKHYEAFKDSYVMPANKGTVSIPLVIYNTDSALQNKSVKLRFKLYANDYFGTALVKEINGTLVFSSTLEKPDWWSDYLGDYYSRTKHLLFLIATNGVRELSRIQDASPKFEIPKNLYIISLLTTFMANPAAWVKNNPGRGYVLEKIPNSDDYDFYSINNPAKKILYKKDAGASTYHFIDEFGQRIN